MVKQRMRRGEPVPDRSAIVLRGLANPPGTSGWFRREDLIEDALTNFDYYGFYGLSVWPVTEEWPLERILAERMRHAPKAALFVAGDLDASGLELWDTGQHPHYDSVHVTAIEATELVDRLLVTRFEVMDNGHYVQDPS